MIMGIFLRSRNTQRGFTIVELLIVIVVIGILAAITIVAFNGVRARASEAALKSDLNGGSKQLAVYNVENGSYPANGNDLTKSEGTTFQYTYTALDNSYCLTATSTGTAKSFFISSTSGIVAEGVCPGHTSSGAQYAWSAVGSPMNLGKAASSSDGAKLVAIRGSSSSYIYTSSDYGATWVERTAPGLRTWSALASSADGTRLVAVVQGGHVFTSTNSGVTWVERTGSGSRSWLSVASSSDGMRLVAGVDGGLLYTSSDAGVTWVERSSVVVGSWVSVASSTDGSKLFALSYEYEETPPYLYTSTNFGATWTQHESTDIMDEYPAWSSIAVSGDGVHVAITSYNTHLYTSSDSGQSWTQRTSVGQRAWSSVAVSNDGSKLVAASNTSYGGTGYIFTSSDSGATWTEQTAAGSRYWTTVAISSDASRIYAGDTDFESRRAIFE